MEVGSTLHPTTAVLNAFAQGKIDDAAAASVMAHLDGCSKCREELAAMTNDEFLIRLRQAHGRASTHAPGKTLNEVVRSLQPPPGPTLVYNLPPELADHPDYEVLRELGRGGMGVVYLAKHRLSGRVEVLKVMSKAVIGQADSRDRFLREIQSAARLDHKNVVKMYTALERGELMVLVMEYVPGEDLAQVVKVHGPLPVLNACYYIQQASSGLQHAYEKGMIHRDIKPQNLILAREGRKHVVKILDFGLAKATHGDDIDTALTNKGVMMGTAGYMAPEQSLDAAAVDIRADLYSLGCTLYHLLAGNPPFTGRSVFEIVQAHHAMEAKPLNLVRPEVPADLAAVVWKMMAKEAAQRYQTPIEVVRALAPFVKGTLKPLSPQPTPAKAGQPDAAPPSEIRATAIRSLASSAKDIAKSLPTKPQPPKSGPRDAVPPLPRQQSIIESRAPIGRARKVLAATVTNSIGMKLALINPGVFLMGSPLNEAERGNDEHPHEVEITWPFYAGVYPVTQEQYQRVMGVNPSWFSSTEGGKDMVKGVDTRLFPVENVSWAEAVVFCRRLSELSEERLDGRTYRLPTEAEWEYLGRGGPYYKRPSLPFYFGNSLSPLQANFDGNFPYGGAAKGAYLPRTTKIGSYPANPLGLYDLHGNVWEWCADWYDAEYYKRSPRQDPQGPENGKCRVLRGGSWISGGRFCRAACRSFYAPGDRLNDNGFRVVLVTERL